MVTNIRKGITLLLAVIMVFALAACGNTNSTSDTDSEKQNSASQNTQNTSEASVTTTEKQASNDTGKILVVYFSWSGHVGGVRRLSCQKVMEDTYEHFIYQRKPE